MFIDHQKQPCTQEELCKFKKIGDVIKIIMFLVIVLNIFFASFDDQVYYNPIIMNETNVSEQRL